MKNRKKIGILTQPLHDNYGGLLQAYALKEILLESGHEVIIINRQKVYNSKILKAAGRFRRLYKLKSFSKSKGMSAIHRNIISKNTRYFIDTYLSEQSNLITNNSEMLRLNKDGFDAFIVGSDQCWRPKYSPNIENFFLDFAKKNKHIKRISYAASFGTNNWEFSKKETKECRKLLKKFDAISVREKSGINLVRNHLSRDDAIHVLDPTMLLTTKHYRKIISDENVKKSKGNLKVYVLDKTLQKEKLIDVIEGKLKLDKFEVMPKKRINKDVITDSNVYEFQYPSPMEWLQGFDDASFVITDSFHGTVFSILFNIPFVCLGNKHRGMARFESLLDLFGLSDRLIEDLSLEDIDNLLKTNIDWSEVNNIVEQERSKSLKFLNESLD